MLSLSGILNGFHNYFVSKYVTPVPFGFYLIKDPEKNKKIALLALPNHEKDI